ncbi:MAG: ABC transporter ATP-binding protein [Gammaproteobacteria bacterium]|nr:ABC transporter ATP-binding protein [Gammaproteobacteria bacterium]
MRLMLALFHKHRWRTITMLLALLLSGLAEGAGISALLPLLNVAIAADRGAGAAVTPPGQFEQIVIDLLAYLGIAPTIGSLLLIIVAGVALKSVLLLVVLRQVGYTAAQLGTELRLDLLRAILRSRWEYFLHQPIGKLTNGLATEAQRSSDSYVYGATAATFMINALIYGAIAVAISWQATLLSLIAGMLVIGASHFLVRATRRAGRRQTLLLSSLMARLTDTLQSVKPLKAMAREHLADTVLAGETYRLNRALERQVFSSALLNSVQDLLFALFIALGMYIALVTFNVELKTVLVLAITLGRGFGSLGKVQKQYQKLAQGESAYWSLQGSIDAATAAAEHLGDGRAPSLEQGIRVEHLSFSYDQRQVFEDLSLEFPARTLTALIGPSGAGKTTIIDLAIGLVRPSAGEIFVDGIAMGELDLRAWRSLIGYVPQDTVLLHDSVLHNVTLGDTALTPADAENALRAAGIWDFVAALPEGMNTLVGERGGKLSGGQRQRVAIARALVNKPRLLILDEATSALDPVSEREICQTLVGLKNDLTILAISHDSALVDIADRVYELARGQARLLEPQRSTVQIK